MDEQRFDAITKALAVGLDRRRAITTLAAGLAAVGISSGRRVAAVGEQPIPADYFVSVTCGPYDLANDTTTCQFCPALTPSFANEPGISHTNVLQTGFFCETFSAGSGVLCYSDDDNSTNNLGTGNDPSDIEEDKLGGYCKYDAGSGCFSLVFDGYVSVDPNADYVGGFPVAPDYAPLTPYIIKAGNYSFYAPGDTVICGAPPQEFGCTPGYWKNHTLDWNCQSPETPVSTVFSAATGSLGSATLLQALSFKGGSTLEGAKQILLRAAVAGYLNGCEFKAGYAYGEGLVDDVNAALGSTDRATILALAEAIDAANNSYCGLTSPNTTAAGNVSAERSNGKQGKGDKDRKHGKNRKHGKRRNR